MEVKKYINQESNWRIKKSESRRLYCPYWIWKQSAFQNFWSSNRRWWGKISYGYWKNKWTI